MYICTTCGKEWPTDYCPECAHTIVAVPRGESSVNAKGGNHKIDGVASGEKVPVTFNSPTRASKSIVSLKAAIAFVVLSLIAVAFPPRMYWTKFIDIDSGKVLTRGVSVPRGHQIVEVYPNEGENTPDPVYLQKRYVTWLSGPTDGPINMEYLILEILVAFCLTMIPGLRSTRARLGVISGVIVVAAFLIVVPLVRVTSGPVDENPMARAYQIRTQVYERILRDLTKQLADGVGASPTSFSASRDRLERYRTALAALERPDVSESLTLKDAMQSDPIRPLIEFYLVTMGCVDQLAYSRSEFVNSPMLEALFFDDNGQEVPGAALKLGITTFVILADEEKKFARVDTEKITQVRIPIWSLVEDALLMILREGIQAGVERDQLCGTLIKIASLRSSRKTVERSASQTRIDEMISELRAVLDSSGEN